MITMRKNQELFWILEVLLLTPVALFWIGVSLMMLGGGNSLFLAVVGEPYSALRSILIAIVCPLAAAWFGYEYLRENKKERGSTRDIAKSIIAISLATVTIVLIYLWGENMPR
jgi:hypothetical protein